MAKKGHKNIKGIPEIWDELKKGVRIMLTPTAIVELDELAKKHGLSRSEFIERIARGLLEVSEPSPPTEQNGSETKAELVA